ncbi:P-loop containing nucleoside triphosphate hydrolase protein [Xylaria arbuscula]|nr:P-loop containing nucleoside triphosphate hydrolase protein [Xylaria arbuscula]
MSDDFIRLAVFGKTGAGKTSFVASATGDELEIGHGADSCTKDVHTSWVKVSKKTVILYDTPGFDDTDSKDPEIFEKISAWLANSEAHNKRLNGAILVQPITDVRAPDSERKRTELFKQIVGTKFYDRVAIVTTMWDQVNQSFGERNEGNRIGDDSLWGDMLAGRAKIFRYNQDNSQSALEILRHFAENPSLSTPASTLFQDELRTHKGRLRETAAAKQFETELGKKVKALQFSVKTVGNKANMVKAHIQALLTWRSRFKNIIMRIGIGVVENVEIAHAVLMVVNGCVGM